LFQNGCGSPVELTIQNFDELAMKGGKNAFVKFHAPWCGHCAKMKPAWDKLGEMYKDSKSVLIGEVDCTTDDGKALCRKKGASAFPTIKYYTRDTGEEGNGYPFSREFEDLDNFVAHDLMQFTWCNGKTKQNCNDDQVAYLVEQHSKTKEEWSKELARLTDMKKYGTPYKAHPEFTDCAVIDPGPACNPPQTPDLKPEEAFQCCNEMGDSCRGFLYVSSDAQKARDGNDHASVYFCKGPDLGDGDFVKQPRDAKSATGYVKPPPDEVWPESLPEAKTWLVQRIEMLTSLLEDPPKQLESTPQEL
jgi:protein disulfide-isomerase A6